MHAGLKIGVAKGRICLANKEGTIQPQSLRATSTRTIYTNAAKAADYFS